MIVNGVLIIIFLLLLIGSSGLLIVGMNTMCRGLMIPFLAGFGGTILFQLVYGLWLLGGYYIYVSFQNLCLIFPRSFFQTNSIHIFYNY